MVKMTEKLPEVVKVLKKEVRASPSKIASEIGSDRRTVDKVLQAGMSLGILKCDKITMSGRVYSSYSLTPEYLSMLKVK